MLKFLTDQNFNNNILRGLLRRNSTLNIIRAQDVGLSEVEDPVLLEWAAQENRVLLTHDVSTITKYAYERLEVGQNMPGIIEVNFSVSIGQAIEDILLLAECSFEGELEGQIHYIPLKQAE
jgi:hypothetical protein